MRFASHRTRVVFGLVGVLLAAAGGLAACSAGSDGSDVEGAGDGGAGGAATGGTDAGGAATGGSLNIGGIGGMPVASCEPGGAPDFDADGFTVDQGDCNDCDANVNPGAIEVEVTEPDMSGEIPEAVDEDCDGVIDNVPDASCDTGIDYSDFDPLNGTKAIGLCKQSSGEGDYGVIGAKYTRASGGPGIAPTHSIGILSSFGPNVNIQEGERMLAISSGAARTPDQPGFCSHSCSWCNTNGGCSAAGTPPTGFPQDVPGCSGEANINDDVALEVVLRAPTNATGYSFDFKFYSNEFPEYVCTSFNDQFIAVVSPEPLGSINGNISFDSMANPVSVNVAFFDVCDPGGIGSFASNCFSGCPAPPNPYCPAGTPELQESGFAVVEGGTSWLQTTAPVGGGEEFNIRFAIWDTGDTAFDSTTLIDNFEWVATGGTVAVGTTPVPTPK